jgi:hypothetical protein
MKLSEAKDKYLFTTKIYLDQIENKKRDDEGNLVVTILPDEAGNYIVLREPTVQEIGVFSDDSKTNFAQLEKLFPKCLVDHSFYTDEDETQKAENGDVYAMLKESGSLFSELVGIWFKSIPFNSRIHKQEKSDSSQN